MTDVTNPPISRVTSRRGVSAGGRSGAPSRTFRTDIEGLRAVAVLAVVLYHAGMPGLGGGFIGVDVFFVVSGFLITGLLWRQVAAGGGVRLGAFYAARARRLLPAAALVLVATAVGAVLLLPPLQARAVLGDAIAGALYVGNYRFAIQGTDYLAATEPSPLQHYWSLGVEEQFYLVWPLLIVGTAWLIARRFGPGAARSVLPFAAVLSAAAAASYAVSLAWTGDWPAWAFFSLPTRAWELAAGGLVALSVGWWRRLPPVAAAAVGWSGLVLIVAACTRVTATTPFPGTAALLPVAGTALVIVAGCATPNLGVGRLLSKPLPRAIGRVSYSWYLWHWPVLILAPAMFGTDLGLASRLAMIVISLGLAILTLHLVENPARFAAALRGSAVRSLAVGGVATAAAVCAAIVLLVIRPVPTGDGPAATPVALTAPAPRDTAGPAPEVAPSAPTPRQQVQAAVAASAEMRSVPADLAPSLGNVTKPEVFVNGCVLSWRDVDQPECVSGDAESAVRVALVGDSHAAMWQPALETVAEQNHWRLETMSKVTCPLMDLPITSPYLGRTFSECEQWRGDVLARLESERPQLIVVDMSRRYGADFGFVSYDPAWVEGLGRLVSRLRATGAAVLVLGPAPDPLSTVPSCVSDHMDDVVACSPGRAAALNAGGIAAEANAAQAAGGSYADLGDLFCTSQRCPVIVGNTLVYRDDNHITGEYAQWLAPVIGEITLGAFAPN
ncbi:MULTISPECIES: acyltransferase family protein [Mycolicibacterium]|uniref:acyltransferase family protein n=1 Tax=Mycolicibacterium monacense TaxID=85693 RepID=UPI0007EA86D0|nr:acyltransferase family protein [Mycolicibacterium monacense]OBB61632.1 acyltransferase [Mycolicibacterium monacense]